MNYKTFLVALVLAIILGFVAKRLSVSPPAPPTWEGVILIAAVVLGYKIG